MYRFCNVSVCRVFITRIGRGGRRLARTMNLLIDLTQPASRRWSYPDYDKIVFTNSEQKTEGVACEVELMERKATLKARSGEVYVFLARIKEGFRIFSGEHVSLVTGDCMGFRRRDGSVRWFMLFSVLKNLPMMREETESLLLHTKNTFLR